MAAHTAPDPDDELALPPEASQALVRLRRRAVRPLERFLRIEASSGILLLVSAAIALAWANSPWASSYFHLWHTPLGLRVGDFAFERPLEWYVNDGLMVIFFFVVGLEIRREVHHGELSEWRRASLPAAAALGGMAAPALIYLAIAGAPATKSGWGVPMATDIAFAVGILTLLGRRVPPPMRVLLLALAVIDDLGAIVVIAVAYSSGIAFAGLAAAGAALAAVIAMQRFGVRRRRAYILPGLVAWAGVYLAGIHPTIAGVILGMMTPVRAWLGPAGFDDLVRRTLDRIRATPPEALTSHALGPELVRIDDACREAMSPAESLIEKLHPWVAFAIMPVFALANAGVAVSGGAIDGDSSRVMGAILAGFLVGKPLGVISAGWLTLALGIGKLPPGMTLRHLVVLGVVAGVGLTMALFIAQLAFADAALLAAAKLGVLAASGAAAVLALTLGRMLPSSEESAPPRH